jgi:hypothetical protein
MELKYFICLKCKNRKYYSKWQKSYKDSTQELISGSYCKGSGESIKELREQNLRECIHFVSNE